MSGAIKAFARKRIRAQHLASKNTIQSLRCTAAGPTSAASRKVHWEQSLGTNTIDLVNTVHLVHPVHSRLGIIGTQNDTEFAREREALAGSRGFAASVAHADVFGAEDVLCFGNGSGEGDDRQGEDDEEREEEAVHVCGEIASMVASVITIA